MNALLAGTSENVAFEQRIRDIREGALAYGDKFYDPDHRLVRRTDNEYKEGRLNIGQHSPEYAGALLDASRAQRGDVARANAIINAMLDHQWLKDKGTRWYGNFFWWHGRDRPTESNAVAFMAPWLSCYLIEHESQLTADTALRLKEALPLCIGAVRKHPGPVHYDNIWFLKAASLVMIGRALERPELLQEAKTRIDQWIEYVSENGISEFNSPCYGAVNIYALEFIHKYALRSADELLARVNRLLECFYADIFQNWHWEAGIGAGTHSRAYQGDRLNGKSLVAFLIYKQCGGRLRADTRAFEYNLALNSYRVPKRIRRFARKDGKTPFLLRASHPCWDIAGQRVERSLVMVPEFSLGAQTGYRANADQAVPFKITYADSKVDERVSYIQPVPPHAEDSKYRAPITFAHHQEGPRAILLYEADLKGLRQNSYLRLVIEPREGEDSDGGTQPGGMLDEILVDGKPYGRNPMELRSGAVIAWRVSRTCVAIRLLDCLGTDPVDPVEIVPRGYSLLPTERIGLCLDGLLCARPKKPVAVNNLSCGFVIRVATTDEVGNLTRFSQAAAGWTIEETRGSGIRDITWTDEQADLRLRWNGKKNTVAARCVNGKPIDEYPLYDSPLIQSTRDLHS